MDVIIRLDKREVIEITDEFGDREAARRYVEQISRAGLWFGDTFYPPARIRECEIVEG